MTLKAGQRFTHEGQAWRVLHVNASRAHCKCEAKQTVMMLDPKTGVERSFVAAGGRTIDISPNSVVELLEGLAPVPTPRPKTPRVDKMVARVAELAKVEGWYWTEAKLVKPLGPRVEATLTYIIEHPGASTKDVVAALGKASDQLVADLKRKGLVEKR